MPILLIGDNGCNSFNVHRGDDDSWTNDWNSSIFSWFWQSDIYITYEFSNTKVIGASERPDLQSMIDISNVDRKWEGINLDECNGK